MVSYKVESLKPDTLVLVRTNDIPISVDCFCVSLVSHLIKAGFSSRQVYFDEFSYCLYLDCKEQVDTVRHIVFSDSATAIIGSSDALVAASNIMGRDVRPSVLNGITPWLAGAKRPPARRNALACLYLNSSLLRKLHVATLQPVAQ